MAIQIKVTIDVEQQRYEGDVPDGHIFTETSRSAMTGSYANTPAAFIKEALNTTVKKATVQAMQRVELTKGDDGEQR